MLKDIKLIIFDLDGTIVDAYDAIIDSFNYMMKKLHLPSADPLAIRRAVGWGDKMLLVPFVKKSLLNKALDIYRPHHRRALLKKSHLIYGARGILTYLKSKGYKLAVASNRPSEFSKILVRHLKIDNFFDYMLCADQLKRGKPDPEIILKIVDFFSVSKQQTIYVGDMTVDVQAAKRAKVKSIAVLTGSSSKEEIRKKKPNYIFRNVSYLKSIL
ncbi:MAG: HAD family hydrolase [Candidatus Omnitrophica bacterium]|nr:HAD family hydrolase [Candidatus Omnitrophota bacterium]HOX54663.1 HAD family hydrolase [Candidatus Omnitrophota bacterium]